MTLWGGCGVAGRVGRGVTGLAAALVVAAGLTGCDGFIYEDEGDCDPKFRVRLKYDKNMKFADAFSNEVNAVTLYVIDEDGNVVYTHEESGERVKEDGYEIVLDGKVKPGNYRLLAWCGEGHLEESQSWKVADSDRMEELTCRLLGDHQVTVGGRAVEVTPGGFHVGREIGDLYHHVTDVTEFPDEEGYHYYTMPLMKDTNSIRVVLQHLSDQPIDAGMFDFTITSGNGHLGHDNELKEHEMVTYHAWNVMSGEAEIVDKYHPGQYQSLIADLTIGRLHLDEMQGGSIYDESDDDGVMRLNVIRRGTETVPEEVVFSVPMVDLALLFKRNSKYNRQLTDQEYLDYQDEYNVVFFIDEGYRWTDTHVYIESWHVVRQDVNLD